MAATLTADLLTYYMVSVQPSYILRTPEHLLEEVSVDGVDLG